MICQNIRFDRLYMSGVCIHRIDQAVIISLDVLDTSLLHWIPRLVLVFSAKNLYVASLLLFCDVKSKPSTISRVIH